MSAIRTLVAAIGLVLVFTAFGGTASAVDVDVIPELNPGSVASALTLLTAGVLMFGSSRRVK